MSAIITELVIVVVHTCYDTYVFLHGLQEVLVKMYINWNLCALLVEM